MVVVMKHTNKYTQLLNNLKYRDSLSQLIIINVAVFLVIALLRVFVVLFEIPAPDLRPYIEISSSISYTFKHIWVLFTYMFVHYDVLHILFNMLMLYWFGRIFLTYFTPKNLIALYLLGGLAGALFYMLTFNTIPYFVKMNPSSMIGASASVMAIIFGAAFYNRDQEVMMFLFGRIKIVYIAVFIFALDFLALGGSSNQGGHIAHIGGAMLGYFYATQYKKGKDITCWINLLIDKIVNLFKAKPNMRVTRKNNKSEDDFSYNQRKHNESSEVDRILDKIKQSGYNSLNNDEKKRLFDASNK